MTAGLFVTGTDTGVGKTRVAEALLRALVAARLKAVGMKPVSAGIAPGASANADVDALRLAGNVDAPLAERNPFAYTPPIAPHVAAEEAHRPIRMESIVAAYARLAARADAVVVEGAGGVLVPLGGGADMLDIAAALRLPVLLVVGVRLGCLNHALLSELAIRARGLVCAGWVANRIDPAMERADESVRTLDALLGAPRVASAAWGGELVLAPEALPMLGFARRAG